MLVDNDVVATFPKEKLEEAPELAGLENICCCEKGTVKLKLELLPEEATLEGVENKLGPLVLLLLLFVTKEEPNKDKLEALEEEAPMP